MALSNRDRVGKGFDLLTEGLEDVVDDWDVAEDASVSGWEATVRLAAIMAKHGADAVSAILPAVQTRVNLDAVKELGFFLFHGAEKKHDTKAVILFNGLVSAWGDVTEAARNPYQYRIPSQKSGFGK